MGNEQYVQHDWSAVTWALMLTGMAVFVVATMGLFLIMVARACNAPDPVRPASDGGHEVDAEELSPVSTAAPSQLPAA